VNPSILSALGGSASGRAAGNCFERRRGSLEPGGKGREFSHTIFGGRGRTKTGAKRRGNSDTLPGKDVTSREGPRV